MRSLIDENCKDQNSKNTPEPPNKRCSTVVKLSEPRLHLFDQQMNSKWEQRGQKKRRASIIFMHSVPRPGHTDMTWQQPQLINKWFKIWDNLAHCRVRKVKSDSKLGQNDPHNRAFLIFLAISVLQNVLHNANQLHLNSSSQPICLLLYEQDTVGKKKNLLIQASNSTI